MKDAKKRLYLISILILAVTVYSFVSASLRIFLMKANMETLSDIITESNLLMVKIITFVFNLLVTLPFVYVGIKGIKFSKKPDLSKAHIVWATIFEVLIIIGIALTVFNMVKTGNIMSDLRALIDSVLEAIVFFVYIKSAKQVVKEAYP